MKIKSLLPALAVTSLLATPAAAAPLYHLVKTVPLGGGVKWDYLHFDAPTHRLYISHGTEVTVVNTRGDRVIGELNVQGGSHGIAVAPVTGDIYADSSTQNVAYAFNPKTFAVLATIPVVEDADGMAYDPASKRVFNVGGDGNGVTPIDPATNKAAPTIALGGAPEFLGADGAGSLYVNINDKNELVRIDTATDQITARWPTTGCVEPTGLAIDPAKRLIFSSCHSGVMDVFNADTGAVVATLPIDKGTDSAAFDPKRHRAFSANSVGTISVISDVGATPVLLGTVKTAPGARTMAVDPANGYIYTVTATVTKVTPATSPNGHPHFTFAPGSLKLLVYAPAA
jgi:DNA-binding beta-propeller fold protein YncE